MAMLFYTSLAEFLKIFEITAYAVHHVNGMAENSILLFEVILR